MKKSTFITTMLIVISSIFANPIVVRVVTSEVYPENDKLKLELGFSIPSSIDYFNYFDSLRIKSNSSNVKVNLSLVNFLVTDAMLSAPLILNKSSDKLYVSSYMGTSLANVDSISWGPGTDVEKLYYGQSIVNYSYIPFAGYGDNHANIISKDNTPSPGAENTTFTGTLEGYITDSLNTFVANKSFYFSRPWFIYNDTQYYDLYLKITTDANGHYSIPAFSKKYVFDKLASNFGTQPTFVDAKPDSFYVEPDSVTHKNISLLYCSDIQNTSTKPTNQAVICNYPNPFNPATTISYSLPTGIIPGTTSIVVSNVKGEQVEVFYPKTAQGSFTFDAKAKATGYYNYSLKQGSKILKSGSMVILK